MPVAGILPVVPTPFRDGAFDLSSFECFLDSAIESVDGYTLLGSTGEAPSLTVDERIRICEKALSVTPLDKTVIVGVTDTCLDDTLRLARHAQDHGAKGVLCAAPYYFANSRDGLFEYYSALDAAIDVDLILYDNPVATGTVLPVEWVVRWSEQLEHLRSVKLTDHDLTKIDVWHAAGLSVFAGDDPILFRYLAAGVDGVMVIVPAIFPRSFRVVYDLARAGDLEGSLAVFAREILPFSHVFGIGDEIATTKAILADRGVFASDELLPPLRPITDERRTLLRAAFDLCQVAAVERS